MQKTVDEILNDLKKLENQIMQEFDALEKLIEEDIKNDVSGSSNS